LRASEAQVTDEPRHDVYFAIRGLLEIARRFDRREEAPSSYRLAELFGTTDAQMRRVLDRLEDARLVALTGGDWTGYVPGCDPDRISLEEIVLVMEAGGLRKVPDIGPEDREKERVSELFQKLNESTAAALGKASIGRLVRDLYAPHVARKDEAV
jgi:DNA-binding IscR family transcriptional regulator